MSETLPVDPEMAVKALALEWLKSIGVPATTVKSVSGYGTDWEGSTDEGFRSAFSVDITYATEAADFNFLEVEGEQMASLWQFVLNRAVARTAADV